MTTLHPTPVAVDILTDSEIVHVGCPHTPDGTFCGTPAETWVDDTSDGPDCVVCLDISRQVGNWCPVTCRPCDCEADQ